MSASDYDPTAHAAGLVATPAEVSETERRARQIAQLVEAERQRRRRTLALCLGLLAVPVAIAAAGLLLAREPRPVSAEELRQQVTPIVENKVGEQIRPVVEEKLGGQIDTAIERRVGDKIQGASPAAVRELGESVEQLKGDLSQVREGVAEVQQMKETLPQIREQLSAQVQDIRRIESRMTQLPPDSNPRLSDEVKKLQERIGGLETHLNRSLESLSAKVDANSRSVKMLSDRFSGVPDMGTTEKEQTRGKKAADAVTRKPRR